MATLYWHNLLANNNATLRENYSTDIAGTVPAAPGSMAADDLRLDGTGPGADDNWIVSAGETVTAASLTSVNYTGTLSVSATGAVVLSGDFDRASGNATSWSGSLTCARVINIGPTNFSNTINRAIITLTGDRFGRTSSGASMTAFINLVLTVPTEFRITGDLVEISGTITGGQAITKSFDRALRLLLTGNGRTSNVASVSIVQGEFAIIMAADASSIIQGLGGAGGEPSACPISIDGNNVTYRLGCSNNGNVEWGNPLTVSAGRTGALLNFQGTSNSATHFGYFEITLDSDLTIRRGAQAGETITFRGNVGWSGTGTVGANAGRVSGAGQLIVERQSGQNFNLVCYWDVGSGAVVEHSGGTLITSPTTGFRATAGYNSIEAAGTYDFGSGTITVDRNARFALRGDSSVVITNTNAITCIGALTGDTTIPTLLITRDSANPVVHFSGLITISCPAVLIDCAGGGNNQLHEILGGVTLTQNSRIVFTGSNNQDVAIASAVSGAFSLGLKATVSGCDIILSVAQAVARAYTIEAGAGYGAHLTVTNALTAATSVEVLNGGRLRYAADGETTLDGLLLLREGSLLDFEPTGRFLRLNSVGPHEWSCALVTQANARLTELRLPTDGTVVSFNFTTTFCVPSLRMTGNITFQTSNPATTVVRPGQTDSSSLPAGVTTAWLERGKTLTLGNNLQLSLNRSNGESTGSSGVATMTGAGRLSFVQPNGWVMPAYPNVVFDVNTAFAAAETNATLTVSGQTFQRDVRVENNAFNITVAFSNITIDGDFHTWTNTAGGAGNQTVRWSGTCSVGGDYYQRHDAAGTGAHRTEFLSGLVMDISGDFRPASAKIGGPGDNASYTMSTFGGENYQLTLRGDWYTRVVGSANLMPLNGTGANLGTVIFDLANQDISINNEYYATIANVTVINASGIPRSITQAQGAWWFNNTIVSGDDITVDLAGSSTEAYGLNISCTGADVTLVLPDYVEFGYTLAFLYAGVPATSTTDLRGFASVDTTNTTFVGVYPDVSGSIWFDSADFSIGDGDMDTPAYDAPAVVFTINDDVTFRNIEPNVGNMTFRCLGVVRTTDSFVTLNQRPGGAGQTWEIDGGTLIVHNLIDLRTMASVNASYDVRLIATNGGLVESQPRGPGALKVLDFGGTTIPPLVVRRLAAPFAGDEPAYGVSLGSWPTSYSANSVLVRNESATVGLTFILGQTVTVTSFTTQKAAAASVTVDFNGFDLRAPAFTFDAATLITKPAGSDLVLTGAGVATLLPPTAELPPVRHQAPGGFSLSGPLVAESYLQTLAGVGAADFNGYDLTISNAVLISSGAVDSGGLAGVTFTCGAFSAASVNMQAATPWFVASASAPNADLMVLQNSDASGSPQGNAETAVDGGGNVNWFFGHPPAGTDDGGLELGLALALAKPF